MSATPSVFDKPLDGDINDVAEGLAILVDGDTAPRAISSGQYLFIKNHTTLATGGYHASSAIASGATISSSNVTADADGIANSINSSVTALNSKIANLVTHDVSQSSATDWDNAIENYVDSLPNDSKCHIGFVQRAGAGVLMCIVQKFNNASYSSCIAFGYWRGPYFYWKDNGTWTAKKLSFD